MKTFAGCLGGFIYMLGTIAEWIIFFIMILSFIGIIFYSGYRLECLRALITWWILKWMIGSLCGLISGILVAYSMD
jgi:hypothetical protein